MEQYKMNFSETEAFRKLSNQIQQSNETIAQMFDKERMKKMSAEICGLFFDFSKNRISTEHLDTLVEIADDIGLKNRIINLFYGKPSGHTVLRKDREHIGAMKTLVDWVSSGNWKTPERITDIVNIGIGGSSIGAKAVCNALQEYKTGRFNVHFISNDDGYTFEKVTSHLNPYTTLFIVSSKSFKTEETIRNLNKAMHWSRDDFKSHFVAVTSNVDAARSYGFETIFKIPDNVGGRFSIWSAIGLPVMFYIGVKNFEKFIDGAREMDWHFLNEDFSKNIPVLLALISLLNRNIYKYGSQSLAVYCDMLSGLVDWVQQLEMESNGKHSAVETAPAIFGGVGTDIQHSFFQWLHCGSETCPVDFIGVLDEKYRDMLINCVAQSEALMISSDGFSGNRPSNTIFMKELSPYTLGALMAVYEHKVFTLGVLYGINSFDQCGVELGKRLARKIRTEIDMRLYEKHDESTRSLIRLVSAI